MTLIVFLCGVASSLVVQALWPRRPETLEEQAWRLVRRNRARHPSTRA